MSNYFQEEMRKNNKEMNKDKWSWFWNVNDSGSDEEILTDGSSSDSESEDTAEDSDHGSPAHATDASISKAYDDEHAIDTDASISKAYDGEHTVKFDKFVPGEEEELPDYAFADTEEGNDYREARVGAVADRLKTLHGYTNMVLGYMIERAEDYVNETFTRQSHPRKEMMVPAIMWNFHEQFYSDFGDIYDDSD
jgi:hypothetical protein